MPIYIYLDKKTGKYYEELRKVADIDKKFTSPDGNVCERVISAPSYTGKSDKEKEVFEIYGEEVKRKKPKFIKFRDGHRERYDPSKHN